MFEGHRLSELERKELIRDVEWIEKRSKDRSSIDKEYILTFILTNDKRGLNIRERHGNDAPPLLHLLTHTEGKATRLVLESDAAHSFIALISVNNSLGERVRVCLRRFDEDSPRYRFPIDDHKRMVVNVLAVPHSVEEVKRQLVADELSKPSQTRTEAFPAASESTDPHSWRFRIRDVQRVAAEYTSKLRAFLIVQLLWLIEVPIRKVYGKWTTLNEAIFREIAARGPKRGILICRLFVFLWDAYTGFGMFLMFCEGFFAYAFAPAEARQRLTNHYPDFIALARMTNNGVIAANCVFWNRSSFYLHAGAIEAWINYVGILTETGFLAMKDSSIIYEMLLPYLFILTLYLFALCAVWNASRETEATTKHCRRRNRRVR